MRRLPFLGPADLELATAAVREVIGSSGVVLLPTETFYGLAAAPDDARAVEEVLALKARPPEMALPVLCGDWVQVDALVEVPDQARRRLSVLWPAALTAVFPGRRPLAACPDGTVAVRIPDHALLRALLLEVGPLTGTSANRHGLPPCIHPDAALASLAGDPRLLLYSGAAPGGLPSTLVSFVQGPARLLRGGAVAWP